MGGPGSGKRRKPLPAGLASELGDLGSTERGILRYLGKLARAVASGQCDPRGADSLAAVARSAISVLRDERKRSEMDELNEMLRRAERQAQLGRERKVQRRLHQLPPTEENANEQAGQTPSEAGQADQAGAGPLLDRQPTGTRGGDDR